MPKSKTKRAKATKTTGMPKRKKNVSHQQRINLQIIYKAEYIPKISQFKNWVKAALAEKCKNPVEINIRIVGTDESAKLNKKYRHKDGATNILSFPCEIPDITGSVSSSLGDLVICAPLVLEEALAQKKTIEAHWAHLTIHGVLHLLGYTHDSEKNAQIMEELEIELMEKLGFENPY